jgi:hypothetical protein
VVADNADACPEYKAHIRAADSGYLSIPFGDPILPGRTHIEVPANYPPDQYWKGESPREEYNYLLVDMQPGQATKLTLNRFRPGSSEPFATLALFGPR